MITDKAVNSYNVVMNDLHFLYWTAVQGVANEREILDTKLRNAIRWCVVREGMLVGKCGGNNFWWHTAAGGSAVIRVPSFHLTGTKLFSRGRQTFVAMTPQEQFSCAAHAGLSSKVPDFYGSKGAVAPKRTTDRTPSFQLNARRLQSKRDKRDG